MAKKTVLQLTQDILSDMSGDEVTSINDTVESAQVASIIEKTFFNIITGKDYPHQKTLLSLTASGTTDRPSHMVLPENLLSLIEVRYNKKLSTDTRDKWSTVKYLKPELFLKYTDYRISTDSNVDTITDLSGEVLYIKNDKAPTYYTSFDDENIVFDSYDTDVATALEESKVKAYGFVLPTFTLEDSHIPDLPVGLFPLLYNEAKSTCFFELKGMPNQKAEQHSISQRRRLSQQAWRVQKGIERPDYGRKSKK